MLLALAFHVAVAGWLASPRVESALRLRVVRPHAFQMASADSPWASYKAFNGDGAWRGVATAIDPLTASPLGTAEYDHYVACEDDAKQSSIRTTTTTTSAPSSETQDEVVKLSAVSTDIDLDGSYSCEHVSGMKLASQLLEAAGAAAGSIEAAQSGLVVEHSLACSDDERRRCLLAYDASHQLTSVLLLVERRRQPGVDVSDDSSLCGAVAPMTLYTLIGTWSGDACVRSLASAAPASPGSRGQGFGRASSARRAVAEAVGGTAARTNVFKTRLTYAWDGAEQFARQLAITSFGGEQLDAIRSVGSVVTHQGEWSDHTSVRFVADATRPALLLLPSGCHILAPLQLPPLGGDDSAGGSYTTEFGAVLEPGESFGWQGYQGPETAGGSAEAMADATDTSAPRLVRSQRLYARGVFVSGTTSLCTAV